MNKKKILVVAMSLAMVAILAIGGTIAYFTDTDSATNTMVVGNLDITINEKNADGEEFDETDYTVMPGQGNVIDKCIWTTLEEGSVDAYVRSIVLFEVNDNGFDFFWNNTKFTKELDTESASPVEYVQGATVTVNGVEFAVACFYPKANNGIMTAGEEYCSVNQVWLDESVTNEQLANLGDNYSILTLSQAVQVSGNTAANNREALNNQFGEINANNVELIESWFADFTFED